MTTFGAKTALQALNPLNHYDRHKTTCTCDEKKTASMISGATWNILNHSEAHEVYLPHARNSEHYIDAKGNNTNLWFEKKRRIDLDGDGVIEALDSSNVQEIMCGPPDSGKEANYLRARRSRQMRQSEHPRDYGKFSARREREGLRTPERAGHLAVKVPFQERQTDVPARQTPRVVSKSEWTPRRGERLQDRAPPAEHEMFRSVDQIRTDSHFNTLEANFADTLHSQAEAMRSARGTRSSAMADITTTRSQLGPKASSRPPKPGHQRQQHSESRIEPSYQRELTEWFQAPTKDKHRREDAFFAKPVSNLGSSCVKYDIISNERKQFWY